MQKESAEQIFTHAAAEVAEGLVRNGLKNPFWVEVYDDRGLGFVCGFRMTQGKASEWSWRAAIEQSDFPVKLVLTDHAGKNCKVWLRGQHLWTPA